MAAPSVRSVSAKRLGRCLWHASRVQVQRVRFWIQISFVACGIYQSIYLFIYLSDLFFFVFDVDQFHTYATQVFFSIPPDIRGGDEKFPVPYLPPTALLEWVWGSFAWAAFKAMYAAAAAEAAVLVAVSVVAAASAAVVGG